VALVSFLVVLNTAEWWDLIFEFGKCYIECYTYSLPVVIYTLVGRQRILSIMVLEKLI